MSCLACLCQTNNGFIIWSPRWTKPWGTWRDWLRKSDHHSTRSYQHLWENTWYFQKEVGNSSSCWYTFIYIIPSPPPSFCTYSQLFWHSELTCNLWGLSQSMSWMWLWAFIAFGAHAWKTSTLPKSHSSWGWGGDLWDPCFCSIWQRFSDVEVPHSLEPGPESSDAAWNQFHSPRNHPNQPRVSIPRESLRHLDQEFFLPSGSPPRWAFWGTQVLSTELDYLTTQCWTQGPIICNAWAAQTVAPGSDLVPS